MVAVEVSAAFVTGDSDCVAQGTEYKAYVTDAVPVVMAAAPTYVMAALAEIAAPATLAATNGVACACARRGGTGTDPDARWRGQGFDAAADIWLAIIYLANPLRLRHKMPTNGANNVCPEQALL